MSVAERIENNRHNRIRIVSDSHKTLLGQYLTPNVIAEFISQLAFRYSKKLQNINILDPGAGQGILFSSFVELFKEHESTLKMHVDAFEIDKTIIPDLNAHAKLLEEKYDVQVNIVDKDFIETSVYDINWGIEKKYTHIVMNPPYKKMNVNSSYYKQLKEIGIETVNLYAAFVALSIQLLSVDGILVAIIPRSFCNGRYFLNFRKNLLRTCDILHIHSFASRTESFKEESVLQENIIIVLKKTKLKSNEVIISASSDRSLANYKEYVFTAEDIVSSGDDQSFINIPSDKNPKISFPFFSSIDELQLSVSTGPIVDFRMKEKLISYDISDTTPLLYAVHLKEGKICWPVVSKKPNSILLNSVEKSKLAYPSGFYVIVKRFSSKEEKRRIWASIITDSDFSSRDFTAENHLNIFHCNKHGLQKEIATGLYVFLNSFYLDDIFRKFSGHTQVNATDLRNLKYPDLDQLTTISKIYYQNMDLNCDKILELAVNKNGK